MRDGPDAIGGSATKRKGAGREPRTGGGRHLSVSGVSKIYTSMAGETTEALQSTTFTAPDGQFISIVGPSGCGKTTLLKICAGLIEPTIGRVQYGAEGARALTARDMGIVFQGSVLLPWRTVLENVMLPADILGLDKSSSQNRARELLDLMGLVNVEAKYPKELSGGMQQRVSIARALLHDPSVLLMDEPFGALDAMTREQLNVQLQEVHLTQRKMVLFVTHNIQEAVFLADRLLVMGKGPGRVIANFEVPLKRPRTTEMYVDEEFRAIEQRTRELLDGQARGEDHVG